MVFVYLVMSCSVDISEGPVFFLMEMEEEWLERGGVWVGVLGGIEKGKIVDQISCMIDWIN